MKRCLPLLFLLVIQPKLMTGSDKTEQEGKALIEQAEAKTNIFELRSFEMKADVRTYNARKLLEGSYLLLWNGPEKWREEITLPGYSEIRVGGKGVVALRRNTDFIPLGIDRLRTALGYGSGATHAASFAHMGPGPRETVTKIHGREINGQKVDCVELADTEKHKREVCIDHVNGTLVRQDPFLDKEMTAIGEKVFPRYLSYVENGKPVSEIRITGFNTTEAIPTSPFEAPPGAVSKPGCMNPIPPHLIKRVIPKYPETDRQSRAQGTVWIDLFVGKEGDIRDARVISGVTSGLNNASLDAVRQWHYDPAKCSEVAVDLEMLLPVVYSLQ